MNKDYASNVITLQSVKNSSKTPLRTVEEKHSHGENTHHFRAKTRAVRGRAMMAMVALMGR